MYSSAALTRSQRLLRRTNLALFSMFFDRRVLAQTQTEIGPRSTLGQYGRALWQQRIIGLNRRAPCPVGLTTTVANYDNFQFVDKQVAILRSPGCYFANHEATISFGRQIWVGPNVGFITANHDPRDPDRHMQAQPIEIGDQCWIGMNAVILPGVHLGPHTTVGAGSVVTRSFPDGHCVIAGSPARIIQEFGSRN